MNFGHCQGRKIFMLYIIYKVIFAKDLQLSAITGSSPCFMNRYSYITNPCFEG